MATITMSSGTSPQAAAPSSQPESGKPHIASDDQRDVASLSLRELLAEDFQTHDRLWLEPGFWAVAVHRLGARSQNVRLRLLRRPLSLAHRILSTGVDWLWGIGLPPSTQVGRRVRIWHHGSILLNARSIGNDVHIRQDTTLGPLRECDSGRPECLPVLDDGVDLGSGVCVLGGVRLGKGCFVGANSVVVQEVPPGATVFGVPARIIPT
jgi:serine O-acetyltransferase